MTNVTHPPQRNMLAVKYHHLRALIHRPFLCLPLLQTNNHPFMELLRREKHRIAQAESTCVQEARQTAQLLHNLVDERSLVHDFPWWQMISCLICASSILFVAEAFCPNQDSFHSTTSAQDLREDAETCLKVFEALSANSAAARKAADMLKALSSLHHSIHRGVCRFFLFWWVFLLILDSCSAVGSRRVYLTAVIALTTTPQRHRSCS